MAEHRIDLRNICVFCGANSGNDPAYQIAARTLGQEMAQRGIGLVYGGGSIGLMGEVAGAVQEGGAPVLGVIPSALAAKERSGESIGELIVVESMHERKAIMAQHADAFITLPGGFGTMDELFEVITWVQIGIQSKSIGLLNIAGYFDPIVVWVETALAQGFVHPQYRDLLIAESDTAILLNRLAEHRPPDGLVKWMDWEQT